MADTQLRTKGSFLAVDNYEYVNEGPFDARTSVGSYEQLVNPLSWIINDRNGDLTTAGNAWCELYQGMVVSVVNSEDTTKNGLYYLKSFNSTYASGLMDKSYSVVKEDIQLTEQLAMVWTKLASCQVVDSKDNLTSLDEGTLVYTKGENKFYIRVGDAWIEIKGEKGDKGDQGEKGDTGADGKAATISVGTVTTGEPGTEASVTNSGTESAAVFDFVIPKGEQGLQGLKGDKGDQGATGDQGPAGNSVTNMSTASFTVDEKDPLVMHNSIDVTYSDETVGHFTIDTKGVQGPKGDKGDQGAQGPQGEQGPKGDQGEKGDGGIVQVSTFTALPSTGDPTVVYLVQDAGTMYSWMNGAYVLVGMGNITVINGGTADERFQ